MDSGQLADNFNCMICLELAQEAVQTQCCGQILCQVCSEDIRKKSTQCPYCRNQINVKASMLSRRMISSIKIQCPDCSKKISGKQRADHKIICPKKKINCRLCMKLFIVQQILQHMKELHQEELIKIIVESHTQSKISSDYSQKSQRIFETKLQNSDGNTSTFGQTGKYYCGKKNLIGKCGCCDGRCGPTNGQNCDSCMQLDLRRYNLYKGFLVNPSGSVCKFDKKTSAYYCGRNQQGKFCTPQAPCWSCGRVKNSVTLGRYSKLI